MILLNLKLFSCVQGNGEGRTKIVYLNVLYFDFFKLVDGVLCRQKRTHDEV